MSWVEHRGEGGGVRKERARERAVCLKRQMDREGGAPTDAGKRKYRGKQEHSVYALKRR